METGLTAAKKLVELLKGKIHVESEYGKGTRISILLPVCDKDYIQFQSGQEVVLQTSVQTNSSL